MNEKLIAFDMDGTLMRDDKSISGRTIQALRAVAEKGMYLVPTTGRSYDGLPEEIRQLPFIRYVIASNGALVYDAKEKKVLHKAEMDKEASKRMLEYMTGLPAMVTCYQNGKGWIDFNGRGPMEAYAPTPQQFPFMKRVFEPIENLKESIWAFGDTTQKLQVFFENGAIRDSYLKEMQETFPEYAISYALLNNIEVNAPEANKGNALHFLCAYLHVAREESLAFGDGINDMTMILEAGTGVAMANAESSVLEIADAVTASNNEDGVAVFLEQLLSEMEG